MMVTVALVRVEVLHHVANQEENANYFFNQATSLRKMVNEDEKIPLRVYLRHFWVRITKQKLVISKDVDTTDRGVYSRSDMVIFAVSCSLGVNLWRSAHLLHKFGDVAPYCFMASGFIQMISFFCFVELTAIQPCVGGPYHFAYNSCGQLIGFFVGWMIIAFCIATTARTFQIGSVLVDETIFGGLIRDSTEKYFNFNHLMDYNGLIGSIFNDHLDIIPFLLGISFSGIVAAEPNDSKMINIGVFFLAFCLLNCFTIILFGCAEMGVWMKHFHIGSIISSFHEINIVTASIYSLMFFGDEAKRPRKDVPAAMLWSFCITYAGFAIFPTLLFLNGSSAQFDSPQVIIEILKSKNFEDLRFLPQLGVTCAVYSSGFVDLFTAVRIMLAMSRDGLLPSTFSKVEHFNKMPVKPTFIAGSIIGLVAVIFNHEFLLQSIYSIHHGMIVLGPILVLKQRYLYSIVHIEKYVTRRKRPSIYAGLVIYALTIVLFMFGYTSNFPLRTLTVHSKSEDGTSYLPPLFTYGILSAGGFLFLITQPQNQPKTKYRVYGVPYVPVFALFLYGFTFQYFPLNKSWIIAVWAGIGLFGYLISVVRKRA